MRAQLMRQIGMGCCGMLAWLGASSRSVEAAKWTMIDFFPAHAFSSVYDLVSADGSSRYTFHFPAAFDAALGGLWGRSLHTSAVTSCDTDWQLSTGKEGLSYFGFITGCYGVHASLISWLVPMLPSSSALPPIVDDVAGYSASYAVVFTNVAYSASGVAGSPSVSTQEWRVNAVGGTLDGEPVLHVHWHGSTGAEEHWYFSDCIRVAQTGQCGKGLRRIQLLQNGVVKLDATFSSWAAKR